MHKYIYRYMWVAFTLIAFPALAQSEPAHELYGRQAWDSHYVNPFSKYGDKHIPYGYNIVLGNYALPLSSFTRISSKFGYRSRFQRMHYGVDFATPVGTQVLSTDKGMVRYVGHQPSGYGLYIIIRHGNGVETIYAHLSKVFVKRGDSVECAEVIALSGNTGASTGPHLHYEIRFLGIPINPELLVNFSERKLLRSVLVFTKDFYRAYNNKSVVGERLITFRSPIDGTLEDVTDSLDLPLELICQLNGLPPDMPIKQGRLLRSFQ